MECNELLDVNGGGGTENDGYGVLGLEGWLKARFDGPSAMLFVVKVLEAHCEDALRGCRGVRVPWPQPIVLPTPLEDDGFNGAKLLRL